MKYIYLDTSHFLKWQNETLNPVVLDKLNRLATSGDYVFVYSSSHGQEIAKRTNTNEIKDILMFLTKIPSISIASHSDLFQLEILHADKIFRGENSIFYPFYNGDNDPLKEEHIDQFLLAHAEQQKEFNQHKDLYEQSSRPIIDIVKKPDKQQFKKLLKESYRNRLKNEIAFAEVGSNKHELLEFILINQNLVPSLKINFYALFNLYRNTKGPNVNDWFDIHHYNAIPYVDFFSLDMRAYRRLNSIREIKDCIGSTCIASSLEAIFRDI